MSKLFSPLTLGATTFPNRLWVSPMCQYSAVDGVVGEWHRVHLGSFATGGFGLVMAEATAIVPEGRISLACPGVYTDEHVVAWRSIVDFAHSQSSLIGIQLAHAGRKSSTREPWSAEPFAQVGDGGWIPVAPSAVAFEGYPTPRAMTREDIWATVANFVAACRRAREADFDVIELHAAHGYLLHEFLSPLSNHRLDEYGGSLENRSRLLLDVARAVRLVCDVPLFVRISATDWTDDGFNVDEAVQVSQWLRDVGVDLIDVSSGGNVANATIPVGPGYQVPLSAKIHQGGVVTCTVGMITTAQQAEDIVLQGDADAVMMAREALRNPHFALHASEELGAQVKWAPQYERARQRLGRLALGPR